MIAANFSRYFFPLPFILITFLLVGRAYGDENTARTMVEDWVGTPGGTDIATVFDRSRSNWFLNYQEYFFLAE